MNSGEDQQNMFLTVPGALGPEASRVAASRHLHSQKVTDMEQLEVPSVPDDHTAVGRETV